VPGRYRSVIRRLTVTADGGGGPASRKRLSRSTLAYGPQTWAALNKNPGGTYPAPTGLAVGSVTLAVKWDAVTVDGKAVASYTVEAIGLNGEVYARETPAANSVVLSNLVSGWTYNILVSANGPGTPLQASLRVTV
jgi:hypothetical protein